MKYFILDVDGVMTTGQFLYDSSGKTHKIFGPDDSDGLNILKDHMEIHFVSADKRGFEISKKRIHDDMGYKIDLVPSSERVKWIESNYNLMDTIYMGDGFFDDLIMSKVGYSIAPSNSDENAKKQADYVTVRSGGDRAVAAQSCSRPAGLEPETILAPRGYRANLIAREQSGGNFPDHPYSARSLAQRAEKDCPGSDSGT